MLPLYKAPTEAKDYYWVKVDRSRMAVRDYKGDLNNVPIGSADFDLIFELPNCQQSRFKVEYQTHIRTGVAFKIYDNGVDVMANLNSFQFQPNSYTYVYPVQHWSSTAGLFGVRFIHSATSGPWVPQNHEVDLKFFYSINFENKEGAEGVTAEVVDVPDECKWYNVKMADFQNQVLNSYGRPTSNTEVKPVLYREGTDIKFQLSDVAPKTDLVVEMMTKVMTKSGPTPEYEERETILKSDNGVYTIPALAGDTWIRISGIRSYEEGDPIPASALENLDKEDVLAYSELTITGEVNEEQFEMIRDKFEGLESLDLTQINNESIPEGAFEGMNQLKDVIVSETVTEIGAGAFKDCENIESLTLPGVTTIGEGAFDGCDNLTSILLPSLGSAQASGKSGIRKAGGIDGVSVESFRGLNPNCLIYVGSVDIPNSESLNVILNVDGTRVAASDIVLDGNHPFNAPASFMLAPNNSRKASSTLRTGTTSILNFPVSSPFILARGTIILRNPNLSASAMRCTIRLTGRTSPLNPTSPAKQMSLGMPVSTLLDKTAAITLRSMAGSVTRMPPAMFRNTSRWGNLKPTRFSSTARSIFSRRKSNPVAERCGVPYAAVLTNACVSISSGRTPSMEQATATPLSSSPSFTSLSNNSDGFSTGRKPLCTIS